MRSCGISDLDHAIYLYQFRARDAPSRQSSAFFNGTISDLWFVLFSFCMRAEIYNIRFIKFEIKKLFYKTCVGGNFFRYSSVDIMVHGLPSVFMNCFICAGRIGREASTRSSRDFC